MDIISLKEALVEVDISAKKCTNYSLQWDLYVRGAIRMYEIVLEHNKKKNNSKTRNYVSLDEDEYVFGLA